MLAVTCTSLDGPQALVVGEVPDPVPGPGQVLVAVRATSLNFPDALMVRGRYQVQPPLPFSPGAELAGEVVAVGEGVTRPAVGDRIVALSGSGGCAQLCVVDAVRTAPLPDDVDFDSGAALTLAHGTALHALQEVAALQPGETLVVLGAAGGTGIAAIECGKAMGARVIACASSAEKLALCREHGADELVDYATEDLKSALARLCGRAGADVVFDAVGGDYTEPAVRSLGWRGRLLVIGFAAGRIPAIPLNLALLRERQILGVYWGDWTARDPRGHVRNMRQLQEWLAEGTVRPPITERIGLADVPEALARMESRQVLGKIVVNP